MTKGHAYNVTYAKLGNTLSVLVFLRTNLRSIIKWEEDACGFVAIAKTGNFKFVAKIWATDFVDDDITKRNTELKDLEYTLATPIRSNGENEVFENELTQKKELRHKSLTRMPTSFDFKYSKKEKKSHQLEIDEDDDTNDEEICTTTTTNPANTNTLNEPFSPSPSPSLEANDDVSKNDSNSVDGNEDDSKLTSDEEDSSDQRDVNYIQNDNDEDDKIEVEIVSHDENSQKVKFSDEITRIPNDENCDLEKMTSNLTRALQPILKTPTTQFKDIRTPSPSDFQDDPDNSIYKKSTKKQIARAGRKLLRALSAIG